nr:S8 family serine peptidase [Asgard group archaeon]
MKRFFGYPLRTLLIAVFIFISTFGLSANTIYPVIAATAEVGWHLEKINITDAWTITQGSPSITIAVLDCGINFTHPELSHAQWVNYDEIANNSIDDDGNGYIDDIYGWNFVGNDNDPNPTYTNIWRNNHGTFIAGVIAAKNDDIGIV